jgi:hypothetical protein
VRGFLHSLVGLGIHLGELGKVDFATISIFSIRLSTAVERAPIIGFLHKTVADHGRKEGVNNVLGSFCHIQDERLPM